MKNSNTMTFTKIIPISDIRKNIKDIPKVGGVYKHYVDKQGLEYLDDIHPTTKEFSNNGIEVYLLYIGKSKDLFDRYKWHLGITNASHKSILGKWLSTLRLSYMANHKNIICLSEQNKLDIFMDEHTYTQYMITEDFHNIEKQLIRENDLPLNVQDNSHDFVYTNKTRRNTINDKYQNKYINDVQNNKRRSNTMIEDKVLREYARKAEKEGITNKSRFLRWFRDIELQSAAQSRLYKAWEERNSDK